MAKRSRDWSFDSGRSVRSRTGLTLLEELLYTHSLEPEAPYITHLDGNVVVGHLVVLNGNLISYIPEDYDQGRMWVTASDWANPVELFDYNHKQINILRILKEKN